MRMKIKRFELVRDSANDEYYKVLPICHVDEDTFFEHFSVDLCVEYFMYLDEYKKGVGCFYKEPGHHGKVIAVFSVNDKRPSPDKAFLLCLWDESNLDVRDKFLDKEEFFRIAEDAHPKKV